MNVNSTCPGPICIRWLPAHKGTQGTGCNCQGRFSGSIKIRCRESSVDMWSGNKDVGVESNRDWAKKKKKEVFLWPRGQVSVGYPSGYRT